MADPIPDNLKPDNLLLLIGINPLPNYVSAKLLMRPETRLHLVVTLETVGLGLHKRLTKMLGLDPEDETRYLLVKSSEPEDIRKKIIRRIADNAGSWGINYTGGKKVMAAQAYRAAEVALINKRQRGIFSYLDAETMDMVIEDPEGITRRFHQKDALKVNIEQVLELHGRQLIKPLKETPEHIEVVTALANYLAKDKARCKVWHTFSKQLHLPNGNLISTSAASRVEVPPEVPLIGKCTLGQLGNDWGESPELIANWLHGAWFEDYVLDQTIRAATITNVHHVASSIRPKGMRHFEVDVAAMQGYRLYAISVTTLGDHEERVSPLAKLKLFEVLTRAQQMGGEEAQAALVTFSEEPEYLEQQVAEILTLHLAGGDYQKILRSVRVFGLQDIPDLAKKLAQWFKEA